MPASYPSSLKIFISRTDFTDTILAAHINDLQDEVAALQAALGINPAVSTALGATYASAEARWEAFEALYVAHTHAHGALTGLTTGDPHTQYMLKSLFTAKGQILGATASGAPAILGVDTDGKFLALASGQATGLQWKTPTAVFYTTHTWAITGEIRVPSGDVDYLVPMFAGEGANETVVLDKVRYRINSGTSATFSMQNNGSNITGFTDLVASTASATTDAADQGITDLDLLAPVVTAVSGTPKNMTITAWLKHTVTVS